MIFIFILLNIIFLFCIIKLSRGSKKTSKKKNNQIYNPPRYQNPEPPKTQPVSKPEPTPVISREKQLRDKFEASEKRRKSIQNKERVAFLESIKDKDPKQDALEVYRGRRTRKTVRRIDNGFEYMKISNTENLTRPGVYGIYAGSTLLYVGKSDRPIEERLREHVKSAKYPEEGGAQQQFLYQAMRDYKDIIEARVLAYAYNDSVDEIRKLETELIQTLNPICNIAR